MSVTKYPLDFELLEKGQTIARAELEEIFGCNATEAAYSLEVRKLIDKIRENAGLLACQSKLSIYIMTDAEASEYTFKTQFKGGVRKMGASIRNRLLIDTAQLSTGEMARFESQSRIMTGTQQATMAALRKQSRLEKLLECGEEAKAS